MIQQQFLPHKGGIYWYRVHLQKVQQCNGSFTGLLEYLQQMFHACPHDFFQEGPRSSRLQFTLPLEVKKIEGHEICGLAREGIQMNHHRGNHMKVQSLLLERDAHTLAVEVPLWMQAAEFQGYETLFQSSLPLTGHIDILRVENGKLWVWDYKPAAFDEKFAATQVYFYAYMLSKRSGIPLEEFRCGYFDEAAAFLFKPPQPEKMKMPAQERLTTFK